MIQRPEPITPFELMEHRAADKQQIIRAAYLMIDQTGYSEVELAKIEFAFESADEGSTEDENMFNGLMAVVDVLAEIHGVDLTSKEQAKKLFVKA